MPQKEKSNYKKKIEDRHKKGKSLKKFILEGANLSGAKLRGGNLSGADLWRTNLFRIDFVRANLSGAELSEANLSGAYLGYANLSGAKLRGGNLSGADLWRTNLFKIDFVRGNLSGAELSEANLSGAKLNRADLSGAKLNRTDLSGAKLWKANLSGATLMHTNLSGAELYGANLRDAILIWADLNDVKGLRMSCFTEKLSDKEKEKPSTYQESYLFVKNYFLKMGLYDDTSKAAYREKVLQRLSYSKIFWKQMVNVYKKKGLNLKKSSLGKLLQRLKYIILNPFISLETFFKILGSRIIDDICGYGEKPKLTVRAAFEIIGFSTIFYWLIGKFEPSLGFIDSLYFSVVTFTTLGLGDIRPISTSLLTRIAVASEALIGAFMIALFVWTLARRGAAR